MKRTCLKKNTNTDKLATCEFSCNNGTGYPDKNSFNEQPFDPKDIQYVKSFVQMKEIIIFVIITILFVSCHDKEIEARFNVINYSSIREIKIESIEVDSFSVDLSKTSCVGKMKIVNNQLVFFDTEFASAYLLTDNYLIADRKLGIGKGPNEVFGIFWIANSLDSNIVIFDANGIIYVVDEQWHVRRKKKYFGYHNNQFNVDFWAEYSGKSIRCLETGNILIPLTCEDKAMNPAGFNNITKRYYKYCPVLGEVDLNTGKTKNIFARRPPIYLNKNGSLMMFINMDFVVKDDNYCISWAVDSLLYVYKYPDSLMYTFGSGGSDMNIQYVRYKKYKEARENVWTDYEKFGYYTQLEYDEKNDLLFRCYYKGNGQGNGMQIYKDTALIADLNMPRHFEFLGNLNGWYFGCGKTDEQKETITLYRFKIF